MKIFQKTQKSSAFTLIEILVVISIMGILAVAATGFNFNKKSEIEKRDRFISSISNLVNKAKTDALLGRGILSGGNIINPESTQINLSNTQLSVTYLNSVGNTIGTGDILTSPFHGESGYTINQITANDSVGGTGTIDSVVFRGTNTSFSGASNSSIILDIEAGFNKNYKHVLFDKRTGRTEIE